uniref:TRM5/TYW2-like N-terminal domain-containing protein n=1 Tax=Ciona savignyi TaxID=51511 RepID=H2Y5Z1_CIOSA
MSQKKMFIVKFQTLIKQNFNKTLCNELVLDLPKRWEKHGDLIVLPCDCFLAEFWKDLPQEKFWECVAEGLHGKRIAKQGRISRNGYRSPQVSMLLGEDGWVTHVDNKIKYNFEVTKCMFASGNITEKIRMAKLN